MQPIILDTDLGGDIDDLGALALLHTLETHGVCELRAVMSVEPQGPALGAIDAMNRFYGRPHIRLGRPRLTLRSKNTYADAVAATSPQPLDLEALPDAVTLYRELLTEAKPETVVIATIGPLFIIDHLLASEPDAVSPLSGVDLVRQAVKRVVTMGGDYPRTVNRVETNFAAWGEPGVTQRVLAALPCPLEICTFELGKIDNGFGTGTRIAELPADHPLRVGYEHFFRHPPGWSRRPPGEIDAWPIWDQITCLRAAMPEAPWLTVDESQRCRVDAAGGSEWHASDEAPHGRLISTLPPERLANEVVETLMLGRMPMVG